MLERPLVPAVQEKESGPKRLSLEEVKAKLFEVIGIVDHARIQEFAGEEETDIAKHEMIATDANGNEILYTYQNAGPKSLVPTIFVTYYQGIISGGQAIKAQILAEYNKTTGQWIDVPREELTREPLPPFQPSSEVIDAEVLPRISPETNEREYQNLLEKFTEAEAIFGTTSITEAEQREAANYEVALEVRAKTRPFLNAIYKELGDLNHGDLNQWQKSGHLTEAQFNELNWRRKKLANLLGAINGGKIRHNLNQL